MSETGGEESIQQRLVQDLLAFYRKHYSHTRKDAASMFWDDFVPADHLHGHGHDMAMQNFFEWIVFDFPLDADSDHTLIDHFLARNRKLTLAERNVLTMMKNSVISLYEVQEVFPGKGLLLKDLLLGGEYDVREKLGSRSLQKWDIFATRLIHVDGKFIMSGSAYPYPLHRKQAILDDIHAEYEDFRQETPDAAMDLFLKENGDIFNFYWYDLIRNPMPMKLHNTDGDPMLFSKAVFEIRDRDAVVRGLAGIKGFEQDERGYTWYDNRKKDGSATILGHIAIEGDTLVLETNSRKRLDKGKRLMLKTLSDALVHKTDTSQDPMEAMRAHEKSSSPPQRDELPIEVQQQVYNQFMQRRYENWFSERIPALEGKTPLEAIGTEEGREKVVELLKLYENGEERNRREGRPYYDLGWVWQRLGIERE